MNANRLFLAERRETGDSKRRMAAARIVISCGQGPDPVCVSQSKCARIGSRVRWAG